MQGVEQWAELRRQHFVDGSSSKSCPAPWR